MKRSIIVGIIVLLMLAVVACDQESSLQDAIARAIAKTSEVQSFHSTTNDIILTDNYVQSRSSEYEYASPDHWHYLQTVTLNGGGNVTVRIFGTSGEGEYWGAEGSSGWTEIIAIDGMFYIRDEDQPEWTESTTSWMSRPLDNKFERYRFLVDLERLIDENIRGVNCSHYRGKVDMDAYVEMMKKRAEEQDENIPEEMLESWKRMRRDELVVDFWIDDEDYIRQWKTEGRTPALYNATGQEQWDTGVSFTRYFDINKPITIEPPEME